MTLIKLLLLLAYLYGAWRFWQGFSQTNYGDRRVMLSLLWPILFLASSSYRENYRRALRG
jgi:hypothetical protein